MNGDGRDFVEPVIGRKETLLRRLQADEVDGREPSGFSHNRGEGFSLRAGNHDEVKAQGVADFAELVLHRIARLVTSAALRSQQLQTRL